MLKNLLTLTAEELAEKTRDVSIPEAALYALLGFLMVFVGITFLIFIVWMVGKIMNGAKAKEKVLVKEKEPVKTALSELSVSQDETAVDDETVAVIMAALMAYYQKNNPKCEFTVKRIKRV